MKYTNMKKNKGSAPKGKKKSAIDHDPFFDGESKKRRKVDYEDDDIDSVDSEADYNDENLGGAAEARSEEEEEETVDEIRKRHAMRQLEMVRELARKKEEEEDEDEERDQGEREGERDSLVAKLLQQEQLEESGRVRRVIASRCSYIYICLFFFFFLRYSINFVFCVCVCVCFVCLCFLVHVIQGSPARN